MNSATKTEKISTGLAILLFLSPALSTAIMMAFADAETQQWSGFQIMVMGMFNAPALFAAVFFLVLGKRAARKNSDSSEVLFWLSSLASICGSVYMFSWGIGAINA